MAKERPEEGSVKRCPECGAQLPDHLGGATCPSCGAQLNQRGRRDTSLREQQIARRQAALYEVGIRRVIVAGLLLTITLLLSLTRIGFIPVPTPAANATISHIPAIIGGILQGPLVGLIVGLGFGFASFMTATVPMFKDPLVAVLPRLFIGLVSAWTYMALRRVDKRTLLMLGALLLALLLGFSYQIATGTLWLGILVAALSVALAIWLYSWGRREDVRVISLALVAALGSLTNTVLVLTIATLRQYMAPGVAIGVGITHGIPEMVVSAVVVVAVVSALGQLGQGRRGSRLRRENSGDRD